MKQEAVKLLIKKKLDKILFVYSCLKPFVYNYSNGFLMNLTTPVYNINTNEY